MGGVIEEVLNEAEIQYRKTLLLLEGWSFAFDTIGGVKHYRAISPDGWLSLIDINGLNEAWAIGKAWGKRSESAQLEFEVAEWIRKKGESAGITWDKTNERFCASLFVKGGHPKEALGKSPSEAVANWKARWERDV